jgi:hypothetical protein
MGKDTTSALLPGTLELLILTTLTVGELHGYAIAQRVKTRSEDVLQVGESSLYPALQRLLLKRWVKPSGARRRTIGARATASSPRPGASRWQSNAKSSAASSSPFTKVLNTN